MATQTVEFPCVTGQAVTAKLFSFGSDTAVASVSATEATNRKGLYAAAFTDVAAGTYRLIALNGSSVPLAAWDVTLTLTTATFQAYEIGMTASSVSSVTGSVGSVATNGITAASLAPDAGTELATAVWSALTSTNYGTGSLGNQVLIGSNTNRSVLVTGSNHAAADVHAFQTDVIDSTALAASAVSEIQSGLATSANQTIIIDGIGYTLAQVQGAVSSPQTSTPAYETSFNGSTYTVTHTGVTSTGVRGTATRAKI